MPLECKQCPGASITRCHQTLEYTHVWCILASTPALTSCRALAPFHPLSLQVIEFAEKPKGEKLTAMKVDTTILGVDGET
jgi:hypothetical protein